MERLLTTCKELSLKVESNEAAAGELLKQCETLQQQLKAMRQVLQVNLAYFLTLGCFMPVSSIVTVFKKLMEV